MNNYPKPSWQPTVTPSIEWTIKKLHEYLPNNKFVIFTNGSCVVWQGEGEPDVDKCKEILKSVVRSYPDFKVRRHRSGDFLVTFKGGVGSIVPGRLLQENFSTLKSEALSKGKLASEMLQVDNNTEDNDVDLIAGLYARARLYLDVETVSVVALNE